MKEKKFFRNCPKCGKKLGHTTKRARDKQVKNNKICCSCTQTGRILSAEHRAKIANTLTGQPGHNHRRKVRDAYIKIYGNKIKTKHNLLTKWGQSVQARDNYTCQKCATKKTRRASMHAHHICFKGYFPELALNLSNGISLCAKCHKQVHAELDTYTLHGKRLDEAGFINHFKEWKPNGSK